MIEVEVAPPHPDGHEAFWLFLRQEQREDVTVDVFYCAHCLGRVETIAPAATAEPENRHRPPLRALGSAARTS